MTNETQAPTITIYEAHGVAGFAANALRNAGFDMTRVSIVGRDAPATGCAAGRGEPGCLNRC